MTELKPGITRTEEMIVEEKDLASVIASGALPVFGTPVMILFAERTCAHSVHPLLEKPFSTVGTLVNLTHVSPTPAGMKVRCESELTQVDGRKLVFSVKVYDECGLIGEGIHERFIVDETKFIQKIERKKESIKGEKN